MANIIKGYSVRKNNLPLVLYSIRNYLKTKQVFFSNITSDGRINSSIDEETIIKKLMVRYPERIQRPNVRMWYDIKVYDFRHGWIPVNIKTTTTTTSDNTGNLAMAVYAYTNFPMNIDNSYCNGPMSKVLLSCLSNNNINTGDRDYYFLVLNKNDPSEIIINSVRGLSILTPNMNNLPFQVCWKRNREYEHKCIKKSLKMFIECIKKPKPSWQESFVSQIREL